MPTLCLLRLSSMDRLPVIRETGHVFTETLLKDLSMSKYKCSVCGYVYNSEEGDLDSGIAAGTLFENLPDDWKCPICGAPKGAFEKME